MDVVNRMGQWKGRKDRAYLQKAFWSQVLKFPLSTAKLPVMAAIRMRINNVWLPIET